MHFRKDGVRPMLELPESQVVADQLNRTIKGKTIKSVTANQSPHKFTFYFGDPQKYDSLLSGRQVGEAYALAGQVEIALGDARLLFTDGANIRYLKEGEKPPVKHQFYSEFTDGTALVTTVQMYGGIHVFLEGQNDNPYYLVAKEKPTPYMEEFNRAYFETLYESVKQNISVKAFLATEQRIPGLGNGVLQDILFHAGIHPKVKIENIDETKRDILFKSLKKTLLEMKEKGGRDTEKNLFGVYGGYQTYLSKKTLEEPCPKCGGWISRQAYLGGNIYFCPKCQPLDGR